ncbi:MAG: hypothetical protein Q9220_001171 [cf. Caloplaca sp. 1 TL-2023]
MTKSIVRVALWASWMLQGTFVGATSCNADNCLRALFPTQSPAVYSSDAAFLTSPGDNSQFAYEFDQVGPISSDSTSHPASVNQDVTVTVGQTYTLTFRTYFDKCTGSEGFVGVKINQIPIYTVDACDADAGTFHDNAAQFTASTNPENLRFEFIIGENPATVKIDNVVVAPL